MYHPLLHPSIKPTVIAKFPLIRLILLLAQLNAKIVLKNAYKLKKVLALRKKIV